VLGLLVAAQAVVGVYLYRKPPNRIGELGESLVQGVLFSQPFLLAFWTVFSSQPFRQRFLWAFLLCILVPFTEELGPLLDLRYTDVRHTDAGFLMMQFVGLFVMAAAFLLVIRRLSRWQIRRSIIEDARSDYQPSQFGIKHLIVFITITALACGLIRSVTIFDGGWAVPFSARWFVHGTFGIACFLLPAIVIPWFVMAYRPRVVRFVVTFAFLWVVCSSAGCAIIAMPQAMRDGIVVFEEFIKSMLTLQLGAGLSILVTSLVMRFCGFRMVRVPTAAR
jgi:hypothetical protein